MFLTRTTLYENRYYRIDFLTLHDYACPFAVNHNISMITCCGFKCSAVALSYQPNYNYLLPYSSRPCARERSVYEVQICLLLSPITFYISRVYVRIIYTRIHNTLQRYNFFFECANIFYRNFGFSVFLPIIPSRFNFASIFFTPFLRIIKFFLLSLLFPSAKTDLSLAHGRDWWSGKRDSVYRIH